MRIHPMPILLFLLASWAPAQILPNQPYIPAVPTKTALPPVQVVGGQLDVATVKTLVPNTHLVFKRMPQAAEFARLSHTRTHGIIVINLAAAPTVAECVRLTHRPRGWKTVMILPRTVTANQLRGFRHLRNNVQVVVPGLHPAQVDALLAPYKNASRSTVSERVCAHLMRH